MKFTGRTSLALVIAAAAGLATVSASAQTVSIGALPQGSLSYSIAAAVAKVIGDKTDLTTRAIGIGGGNIYFPQVNQGRLDMSTAAGPSVIFASTGTGPITLGVGPEWRAPQPPRSEIEASIARPNRAERIAVFAAELT